MQEWIVVREYHQTGENPVLAVVGGPGTRKTNFLISFFELVLNCLVLVLKTADEQRHASFFKEKQYTFIYNDLDWKNETMTRQGILHLLSGEVTTTSNIKRSTVLVPKETYQALTSNYSLHNTHKNARQDRTACSTLYIRAKVLLESVLVQVTCFQ